MPEGYQPTLRLPDHQPGVSPQQAPPANQKPSQDSGPSATQQPEHGQFSSPYPPIYGESGRTPYASGQAGYGQASQPYGQPGQQYGQQYGQPGSPNAYGQPAYYGVPAAPKTLSIASMCCGIAALVGFGFFLLPQLAAVILGHLALRREPAGRGMAIAGLVMGYVGIAITILLLVIFGLVIGAARNSGYGV
ncbi:hypothetical protein NicSoilB8_02420 [Arthrobacter sp. NicSoilB8]|nr:hypothetical protein NicSoilB8_02420 [Arthrobacter sp. NicSoilB8]